MIVENITKLSSDEAYNILMESEKKTTNIKYVYVLGSIILGIVTIVVAAILSNTSGIIMGGFIAAFGIAYFINIMITVAKTPKRIKKENSEILEHGATYSYRFREQGLDFCMQIGTKKNKKSYEYGDFKSIFEYEDHFKLHLSPSGLFIIKKEGFKNDKEIEIFRHNVELKKKLKIKDKRRKK